MSGQLEILIALERSAAKGEPDVLVRIGKAMKVTKSHWMIIDEDIQFRAAIGIALLESDEIDKERILRSYRPLQTLSAMMQGIPVDTDAMTNQLDHDDLIPLIKMWRDA